MERAWVVRAGRRVGQGGDARVCHNVGKSVLAKKGTRNGTSASVGRGEYVLVQVHRNTMTKLPGSECTPPASSLPVHSAAEWDGDAGGAWGLSVCSQRTWRSDPPREHSCPRRLGLKHTPPSSSPQRCVPMTEARSRGLSVPRSGWRCAGAGLLMRCTFCRPEVS